MRQRRAKNMEERLQECGKYLINDPSPEALKGCFGGDGDLFLEIGCGKGQFIIKKALENSDSNFVAIEGQEAVMLRALEKCAVLNGAIVTNEDTEGQIEFLRRIKDASYDEDAEVLENLRFICKFVNGMDELFGESSLSGVYLNFSDPWPKARHNKRRLTYRGRLMDYVWALKPGGFIEIKTDNEGLFEFTLEEIASCQEEHPEAGMKICQMTRDLHSEACDYESKKTMTEYETKFSSNGKNINYVKVIAEKR
ncbi:MAG: tRNA (guanosine(46)-N7)-methyltransferase TrmB [Firmicutes bacterium]|nr:tRNA (guanosine(46)-N7)-methyltransferase TrmB [Bacillota bacterium]